MYKCKYFAIQELVFPKVHEQRGNKAWKLLDSRLLITIDQLRKKFGPITINNWNIDGNRQYSGLRQCNDPHFSQYSSHTFGRAADMLFKDIDANTVREYILDHPNEFEYINEIELDTSWLHISVSNSPRITTFSP